MLWLQSLPAAVLWLAFIWLRRKWVQCEGARHSARTRGWRIVLMLGSVLASLGSLFGGFLLLTSQTALASGGQLTAIGMAFVAIIGLVFLHFQMLALALTLSLAFERETAAVAPSSDPANTSQGENS